MDDKYIRVEIHVLYLIELQEGPVFTFDQQNMYDFSTGKYVDGIPLGSIEVAMDEQGDVFIYPIGHLGLRLQ